MGKIKRIILTVLVLIGLALSIELCVVYYNANFIVDARPSICAISESIDCDSVAKTAYSQFFGIPLSLWGVFFYLFVLFMTYVDKIRKAKFLSFLNVFKNQTSYIFCVGLISFIISMILGCISVKKINSICVFCFMTYFIDLLITLVSKNWGNGLFYEVKQSIQDFVDAIKVKRYAFWFILIVLFAFAFLSYTTVSNILTPQIAKKKEMLSAFSEYSNLVDGNIMGPKDANVIIHEFMDFNCGGCFLANLYLHRIINEFENVKVIQHNVPLDKTCNHNMKFDGHKNSCLKTSYALAAAKQNRYWEMSDILFAENPETEKEIIEKARLVDFDIKKLKEDAHSAEIKEEIKKSIEFADSKNVDGTPTFYIGIRRILGTTSYPAFKQIVIEQGGKEKIHHD